MNTEALTALWQLGGHGAFVWGAYGVAVAACLVEALSVRRRLRRSLARAQADAGDAA